MTASTTISHEAQAWVVRLHSDQITREDERGFSEWLAADPRHGAAYDEQLVLWRSVAALAHDPAHRAAVSALRDAGPNPNRRALMAASLGAGALAAGVGGWSVWQALSGETYQTAVGEQRRVVLADGSVLTLNTDSRLHVDLREAERRIRLDKGQAFFAVAKDSARPFRVFAGGDEVRALGTAFDVRRDGSRARVTLEEGSVALFRPSPSRVVGTAERPSRPVAVLQPGEQADLDGARALQIRSVVAREATAWRFGQLVLDKETLASAVAEINRYNRRRIVISDPEIAEMTVSGVFQTGRPEAFVEALTAVLPVRLLREDDDALYLANRA